MTKFYIVIKTTLEGTIAIEADDFDQAVAEAQNLTPKSLLEDMTNVDNIAEEELEIEGVYK